MRKGAVRKSFILTIILVVVLLFGCVSQPLSLENVPEEVLEQSITTKVVSGESLSSEGLIKIPTTSEVNAIVGCSDWDEQTNDCDSGWVQIDVPFSDKGDYIEFEGSSSMVYAGINIDITDPNNPRPMADSASAPSQSSDLAPSKKSGLGSKATSDCNPGSWVCTTECDDITQAGYNAGAWASNVGEALCYDLAPAASYLTVLSDASNANYCDDNLWNYDGDCVEFYDSGTDAYYLCPSYERNYELSVSDIDCSCNGSNTAGVWDACNSNGYYPATFFDFTSEFFTGSVGGGSGSGCTAVSENCSSDCNSLFLGDYTDWDYDGTSEHCYDISMEALVLFDTTGEVCDTNLKQHGDYGCAQYSDSMAGKDYLCPGYNRNGGEVTDSDCYCSGDATGFSYELCSNYLANFDLPSTLFNFSHDFFLAGLEEASATGNLSCDPSIGECTRTCSDIDITSDSFSWSSDGMNESCTEQIEGGNDVTIYSDVSQCDNYLGGIDESGGCVQLIESNTMIEYACPSYDRSGSSVTAADCYCSGELTAWSYTPCSTYTGINESYDASLVFNFSNSFFTGSEDPIVGVILSIPAMDESFTYGEFTDFSVIVTCDSGDCGEIAVSLDPFPASCDPGMCDDCSSLDAMGLGTSWTNFEADYCYDSDSNSGLVVYSTSSNDCYDKFGTYSSCVRYDVGSNYIWCPSYDMLVGAVNDYDCSCYDFGDSLIDCGSNGLLPTSYIDLSQEFFAGAAEETTPVTGCDPDSMDCTSTCNNLTTTETSILWTNDMDQACEASDSDLFIYGEMAAQCDLMFGGSPGTCAKMEVPGFGAIWCPSYNLESAEVYDYSCICYDGDVNPTTCTGDLTPNTYFDFSHEFFTGALEIGSSCSPYTMSCDSGCDNIFMTFEGFTSSGSYNPSDTVCTASTGTEDVVIYVDADSAQFCDNMFPSSSGEYGCIHYMDSVTGKEYVCPSYNRQGGMVSGSECQCLEDGVTNSWESCSLYVADFSPGTIFDFTHDFFFTGTEESLAAGGAPAGGAAAYCTPGNDACNSDCNSLFMSYSDPSWVMDLGACVPSAMDVNIYTDEGGYCDAQLGDGYYGCVYYNDVLNSKEYYCPSYNRAGTMVSSMDCLCGSINTVGFENCMSGDHSADFDMASVFDFAHDFFAMGSHELAAETVTPEAPVSTVCDPVLNCGTDCNNLIPGYGGASWVFDSSCHDTVLTNLNIYPDQANPSSFCDNVFTVDVSGNCAFYYEETQPIYYVCPSYTRNYLTEVMDTNCVCSTDAISYGVCDPYNPASTYFNFTDEFFSGATATATDTATPAIGGGAVKGLISTTPGAIPFYTTDDNPQYVNLSSGETSIVSWAVNTTGTVGEAYTFFAFVNMTSDPIDSYSESNNITITIVNGSESENPDGCSPYVEDCDSGCDQLFQSFIGDSWSYEVAGFCDGSDISGEINMMVQTDSDSVCDDSLGAGDYGCAIYHLDYYDPELKSKEITCPSYNRNGGTVSSTDCMCYGEMTGYVWDSCLSHAVYFDPDSIFDFTYDFFFSGQEELDAAGGESSSSESPEEGVEFGVDAGWNKTIDIGPNDIPYAMTVDGENNIYVVGQGGDNWDWIIKKFGSDGTEDTIYWDKQISEGTIAYDAAIDSSGSVFVVGSARNCVTGTSSFDWMIKKYNSVGVEDTRDWNQCYSSDGFSYDSAMGIEIDDFGNIYVLGRGENLVNKVGFSTASDWWIKKFDSGGNELDFGGSSLSECGSLDQGSTCTTNYLDVVFDYAGDSDAPYDLTSDISGNIYVVGKAYDGMAMWWLKKFDSSGVEDTINWNKIIRSHPTQSYDSEAYGVEVDDSGDIFVVGYGAFDDSMDYDWIIKKYSSEGIESGTISGWNKTLDEGESGRARSIYIDENGDVFVVGQTGYLGMEDMKIKKFDDTGTEDSSAWNTTIGIRMVDIAYSVVKGNEGDLYVAGSSTDEVDSEDWILKKFEASVAESSEGPVGEICGNGIDDDGFFGTDCEDTQCHGQEAPGGFYGFYVCDSTEIDCFDGADNNGNGFIDCADPECSVIPECTNIAGTAGCGFFYGEESACLAMGCEYDTWSNTCHFSDDAFGCDDICDFCTTSPDCGSSSKDCQWESDAWLPEGGFCHENWDTFVHHTTGSWNAGTDMWEDVVPIDCDMNPDQCDSGCAGGHCSFESFCFNNYDDDYDGFADCDDPDCLWAWECKDAYNSESDSDAPSIRDISKHLDSIAAFIDFMTTEPTNATLTFYLNDSTCTTLNSSLDSYNDPYYDLDDYKLFHSFPLDQWDDSLGFNLTAATTYFYELNVTDMAGLGYQTACLNFTTKKTSQNFMVSFEGEEADFIQWKTSTGDYEEYNSSTGVSTGVQKNASFILNSSATGLACEFGDIDITHSTTVNFSDAFTTGESCYYAGQECVGIQSAVWQEMFQEFSIGSVDCYIPGDSCESIERCSDDGANCSDVTDAIDCAEYNSTHVAITIPPEMGFSTYVAGENSQLEISDTSDSESVYVDGAVVFYANYSKTSDNTTLTPATDDAECRITVADLSVTDTNMTFNSSGDNTWNYTSTSGFSSANLYDFTINCTATAYTQLNATDDALIETEFGGQGEAVPEFSDYAIMLLLALTVGGFVIIRRKED
ncbi:hypothetical protein HN587_02725 [Candidatus Woesearchaeota archaeon]|jgi:hypothetical protein|nr:hypothetical protein [Candidatus Woesearchaeota archaeon]